MTAPFRRHAPTRKHWRADVMQIILARRGVIPEWMICGMARRSGWSEAHIEELAKAERERVGA